MKTLLQNETSESSAVLPGFAGEIVKMFSEKMEVNISIQPPEDFFGINDTLTNKWTGVIGKLINKETDIGMSEFSITKKRLEVIDFSEPIITSPVKFFIKRPTENVLSQSMYYRVKAVTIFKSIIFNEHTIIL